MGMEIIFFILHVCGPRDHRADVFVALFSLVVVLCGSREQRRLLPGVDGFVKIQPQFFLLLPDFVQRGSLGAVENGRRLRAGHRHLVVEFEGGLFKIGRFVAFVDFRSP